MILLFKKILEVIRKKAEQEVHDKLWMIQSWFDFKVWAICKLAGSDIKIVANVRVYGSVHVKENWLVFGNEFVAKNPSYEYTIESKEEEGDEAFRI